jgi:Na+-translocating ferredoxin:NAD+ oxidoreductase RNF subunit RnfB
MYNLGNAQRLQIKGQLIRGRTKMGHIGDAKEQIYHALAERLNKNPVGVPVNETLMQILQRLYSESEAMVGSKFPLIPMTLEKISGITGIEEIELKPILESMANKGLVMDFPRRDTYYYMLAPMVVGFFEYTFMRTGDKLELKELAELFYTYFHSDEVRKEFSGKDTKMMRTLVYESVIPVAVETEVLDYERAAEIIRNSGGGAISMCACRHKAEHLGKACGNPVDVCTSLGGAAEWIVRRGLGRSATVEELLEVLARTEKLGLVHLCDNVMNKPTYICHCCGCCCQVLSSINESGLSFTNPSNFVPSLHKDKCSACGICVDRCQIHALTMGDEYPMVKEEVCIGCGVCASVCPEEAWEMARKESITIPPANPAEKFKRIALEKTSNN